MKKEEIIHLHMLLVQLKEFCEKNGLACDFVRYKSLDISPFQVHRSKEEHKQAIFVLLSELVSAAAKKSSVISPEMLLKK
ncbi:MAG: UPF0058 family protein [Canidatus Methanoxibalbensis ujae]|nr:UPF0058 family protein [Candidatus Methanoxibalbensis ujae]MCW7078665.1 UPF0058 family protein [Candidatus Methanoxibalbensis ujae]RLG38580.1 MAG: metal-binding protein [Methanosarcinales archaeon]